MDPTQIPAHRLWRSIPEQPDQVFVFIGGHF